MKLRVLKCHGAGNDFILIDIREFEETFSDEIKANLSIKLCNRENSIGADGILYIANSTASDCQMRIFNTDGSEAEMCGNGIRIVGRYISEEKGRDVVEVENVTGLKYRIEKVKDFFKGVAACKVNLPVAIFRPELIPISTNSEDFNNVSVAELSDHLKFTGLAMPNPHLITIVKDIEVDRLEDIGLKANKDNKLFPNGINVSVVKLIDNQTIYVATYERGVGITYSCGTAMCASGIVAIKNSIAQFNSRIKVLNKGGFIYVDVRPDWSCTMTGNATYVFTAEIDFDVSNETVLGIEEGETFVEETLAYNELIESLKANV